MNATSPAYRSLIFRGGRLFAIAEIPPAEQPVLVTMESPDKPAAARTIVDPVKVDASGHTAMDFYEPSLDGRLCGGIAFPGRERERRRACVRNGYGQGAGGRGAARQRRNRGRQRGVERRRVGILLHALPAPGESGPRLTSISTNRSGSTSWALRKAPTPIRWERIFRGSRRSGWKARSTAVYAGHHGQRRRRRFRALSERAGRRLDADRAARRTHLAGDVWQRTEISTCCRTRMRPWQGAADAAAKPALAAAQTVVPESGVAIGERLLPAANRAVCRGPGGRTIRDPRLRYRRGTAGDGPDRSRSRRCCRWCGTSGRAAVRNVSFVARRPGIASTRRRKRVARDERCARPRRRTSATCEVIARVRRPPRTAPRSRSTSCAARALEARRQQSHAALRLRRLRHQHDAALLRRRGAAVRARRASTRSPTCAAAASSARRGTGPAMLTQKQNVFDDFAAVRAVPDRPQVHQPDEARRSRAAATAGC